MMAANHSRIMATCLGITPLFLVASPPARQLTGTEISLDPRATYLRTNQDAGALNATPIDLSTLIIVPGDGLRLERLGDFDCGGPCVDDRTGMIGVCFMGLGNPIVDKKVFALQEFFRRQLGVLRAVVVRHDLAAERARHRLEAPARGERRLGLLVELGHRFERRTQPRPAPRDRVVAAPPEQHHVRAVERIASRGPREQVEDLDLSHFAREAAREAADLLAEHRVVRVTDLEEQKADGRARHAEEPLG